MSSFACSHWITCWHYTIYLPVCLTHVVSWHHHQGNAIRWFLSFSCRFLCSLPRLSVLTLGPIRAHSRAYLYSLSHTPTRADAWISTGEWKKANPPTLQLPSLQSTELHSIFRLSLTCVILSELSSMTWVLLFCLSKSITNTSWVLHTSISTLFESHRTKWTTRKVTCATKLIWR